ncbi:MAG TPA: condensation domain-containing protein, partial [Thermoanaerobaculia bacterium]
LPAHMVPSAYVFLDAFPQTPSGKVDRRALARIAPHRQEEAAYVAPRNPVEQALADIWAAVLGEERTGGQVGVHDNFFDLGGHSLIASRLIARIRSGMGVELPVRALFEAPTVAGLAERLEGMGGGRADTIPRQPRTPGEPQRFPVSFSQLREWILDRLEPGTAAYNVPSPKRITGSLSIPAFALSLRETVRRHESLRTTFEAGPEEPLQVVAPALEIPLPVIDLEGLPDPLPELRRLLEEDLRAGFDLERGPLLRVRLVRSAARDHTLFLTMHHIISDGWSTGVLSRELAALYEGFSQGRPVRFSELPVQYPDYAVWQRTRLQGERLEELVGYWRGQLAGAPPLLELPTDRPRPAVRSARGERLRFELPATLVAPLRTAAAAQGGSLFMGLLAVFQTLLARLSGQDDVAVGTFSGNRGRFELEGLIGFFINTLALRTDLSGEPSLRELLGRVREVTLGAYAHQEIPFEKLLESLSVPRDTSRTPIFQTMLVLQNFPKERIELSGIALEPLPFRAQRSNFDLTLWMMEEEGEDGLVCEAEYSTDLFEEATVVRMTGYLKSLAEAAGAEPGASLWTLALMPPSERAQVLEGWSRTADAPPGEPLLHRLFEAQAARTPDSIAVVAGEEELTYAELNEKAGRLARHLRRLGVGPESRVGLSVDRSTAMLVGMLGVLKAGGAYVPLDPAYPQDRLAYMIEDSGARVILDRERLAELDRDEPGPEPVEIHPENAAYVIYTSGSTGRPKGVVVSHRSIAAYTRTAREYYAIGPDDRMLQFGSISFDTSAEEIYPTLTAGATLVLRPDDMALSMSHFLQGLDRFGITVLAMQTAFWHEIVAGLVDGLALP